MRFSTVVSRLEQLQAPIILPLSEDGAQSQLFNELNDSLSGLLVGLMEEGALRGRSDTQEIVHIRNGAPLDRVLLMGTGKSAGFDLKRLSEWCMRCARKMRRAGMSTATVQLPAVTGASHAQMARAAVEGFELGANEFLKYKSKEDPRVELTEVRLLAENDDRRAELDQGLVIGEAVAAGMTFARALSNEPGNVATPTYMADEARKMAEAEGLTCTVLERDEMRELGMGALLGVAQGSAEPPKLVVLELGSADAPATLALVGKGVTFDSGGISIKPSAHMGLMKFDMCGGAAVLGAMLALARLKPTIRVIGLVPLVENMPSGTAMKPGDIVRAMSGLTIEVTNTDAEGRLILSDALAYSHRYEPDAIIDIATLTGAMVVALGAHATGVMGNNDSFVEHVRQSGNRTGERIWPLPLWPEHHEDIKSSSADMVNSSDAGARAITAGALLEKFVDDVPWAHLDIAGTAWIDKNGDAPLTGATGVGVRTMVEAALSWKAPTPDAP